MYCDIMMNIYGVVKFFMELNNTINEIELKLKNKDFSSYALLVGYGDSQWQYFSDDVNLDTYFDGASVGKVFPTSALALQAIGKGLISLDDKLTRFFDDVPNDKQNITVKQLMTHTQFVINGFKHIKISCRF